MVLLTTCLIRSARWDLRYPVGPGGRVQRVQQHLLLFIAFLWVGYWLLDTIGLAAQHKNHSMDATGLAGTALWMLCKTFTGTPIWQHPKIFIFPSTHFGCCYSCCDYNQHQNLRDPAPASSACSTEKVQARSNPSKTLFKKFLCHLCSSLDVTEKI